MFFLLSTRYGKSIRGCLMLKSRREKAFVKIRWAFLHKEFYFTGEILQIILFLFYRLFYFMGESVLWEFFRQCAKAKRKRNVLISIIKDEFHKIYGLISRYVAERSRDYKGLILSSLIISSPCRLARPNLRAEIFFRWRPLIFNEFDADLLDGKRCFSN